MGVDLYYRISFPMLGDYISGVQIKGIRLSRLEFGIFIQDIRNQHRYRQQRKLELKRLSETLEKLNSKASFYEEQMNYYHQYVKACLDQLANAGSKGGRVQGPGQQGGAGFKKQSIKYSAHKLHEKGVILEIEGLPNHQ